VAIPRLSPGTSGLVRRLAREPREVAWVSITPLARPVVPPVYMSSARSESRARPIAAGSACSSA